MSDDSERGGPWRSWFDLAVAQRLHALLGCDGVDHLCYYGESFDGAALNLFGLCFADLDHHVLATGR